VDGITGEEDQKRDEEFTSPDVGYPSRSDIEMVAWATGGGFLSTDVQFEDDDEALTPVELLLYEHFRYLGCRQWTMVATDDCAGMAVEVIRFLTLRDVIQKIGEAAYRAGREDLLRSGSCPECTAGDPHNEPDKPHIHLTAYGYLLYAPDHDQLDFVRQIREIERRAGYAEAVARLREDDRYRNWWTAHPDQQFGTAYWAPDGRQHLADYLETVGPDGPDVRTKPVDQSGVQPTEEQRAVAEDQKRDEEIEHG
jgi:hypothetical protein